MPQRLKAFNELFAKHYRHLTAWCRMHVQAQLGDPEDFVHLAYLRCIRRWSEESRSNGHEAAYLYRALRWVILDVVRRHLREKRRAGDTLTRGNDTPHVVLHQLIAEEAFLSLSGRQLQVCLALLKGKSSGEIRRELNMTPGAIAVNLHRARRNLCEYMEISRT